MVLQKRYVYCPGGPLMDCHAATLVELADGTLLCAWYAAEGPDTAIYGARLAPGDREWREWNVLTDTPGFSDGNPVLLRDNHNRLWLFFVTRFGDRWDTCQVKFCHSLDAGQSWGDPYLLRADWGWMTGCKPLLRPDGTILLPLYAERGGAFVLRTEDGGMHWEMSQVVQNRTGVIQPSIAPLSHGRLLMLLRTCEKARGTIWQAFSGDDGRTWSNPERTALPNPGARIDLIRLHSGRMALAFNDSSEARTPLTVALSEDEGRTWPVRLDLEVGNREYSYPTLLQTRDNLLHIVYTCYHTHIAHLTCDEAYILAHGRIVP
ncbi:MAG: sialidase family protein [Chloroherpetonaceae bacterium]|nr:exo-alpha-sialidase [Chthonomonadaceae bacterium]MDW8207566.1 sialidase family protein [Chloroherpetonaceae bacterium]